jgi:hypothetical protein
MDVTQVTVQYGRTVSDGGAGSERMVITLTATKEVVTELGEVAQGLVEDQLRRAGAGATPDGAGTVAHGPGDAP